MGWAYALAGKREEALAIISELLEAKKREFTPAINIARVYGGLSETDKTYEWLEKALDEHNAELVYLELISANSKKIRQRGHKLTFKHLDQNIPLLLGTCRSRRRSRPLLTVPAGVTSLAKPIRM